MAKPADLNALRAMEAEAQQCERVNDILGALDIYEEICRSEWAGAKQLTALGDCYLKNRQRQNAKEVWLRAITYEPNYEPCIEVLNKYFPGWQKQRAQQASKNPLAQTEVRESPPPPPNPYDETQLSGLTVEVIRPAAFQPPPPVQAAEPAPPPPAPARAPAPAPEAAPKAKPDEAVAVYMVNAPSPTKEVEGRANWNFILADVAEEAASVK